MASIATVVRTSGIRARQRLWSMRTTAAQNASALTRLRKTILRTSPTVPEKTVIRRVGSERARVAALGRDGSSVRTASVLSGSSSSART
jgi:hypothetical protein